MFTQKEKPKYQRDLESELESAVLRLKANLLGSDEYAKELAHVERLYEMMDNKSTSRISPDTRATVAANLLGILLILKHEHVNVITSKALSFVIRTR